MLTFFLKSPRDTKSYIWVQGRINGTRIRRSTGALIETKWFRDGWITTKGADRATKNTLETIESKLKHIRATIDTMTVAATVSNRAITAHAIESVISGKPIDNTALFSHVCTRIITMAGRGELTKKGGQAYTHNTLIAWGMSRDVVIDAIGDNPIDAITITHIRDMVSTLNRRGRTRNFIAAHIKNFKNFMGIAHRMGMTTNDVHRHHDFRPSFEHIDKIYLTEAEVQKLASVVIPDNKLAIIRDRWLVMYYTGLRISDSGAITMQNIENGTLTMMNKKTKKVVVVPLSRGLRDVIERHNGIPRAYSTSVINVGIKQVAKMAGLTDKFTYTETSGGVTRSITKEKWELISCHTARRSTVSNMVRNGITHELAGDMLGMTAQTFAIYNRMTAKDKATELANHPFFK